MIPSSRMEGDSLEFRQSFEIFSFDDGNVKRADRRYKDLRSRISVSFDEV